MSVLKKQYQTDGDAEREGIWVSLDEIPGMRVLIARSGGSNKKYLDALQSKMTPHQRVLNKTILDGRDIPPAVAEKIITIQKELHAEFVLLDWDGEEEDDGTPIKYTPEIGLKYFKDEEMKEFWDIIQLFARDISLFRKEVIELQAKNFKKSSGINSQQANTKKK